MLIYSARPERGLDHLAGTIMPKLIARDPEIMLGICGYTNKANELEDFYRHCGSLLANLGDRVKNFGALTKPELYKLYSIVRRIHLPDTAADERPIP
jgi:hypothetical protein